MNGEGLGRTVTAITNSGSKRWVQVEGSNDRGLPVLAGLSGSPVWCKEDKMFVGMVVARDTRKDKVGFIIPTTELIAPMRVVHRRSLQDILDPYSSRLSSDFATAYWVCRRALLHKWVDR